MNPVAVPLPVAGPGRSPSSGARAAPQGAKSPGRPQGGLEALALVGRSVFHLLGEPWLSGVDVTSSGPLGHPGKVNLLGSVLEEL